MHHVAVEHNFEWDPPMPVISEKI